MAVLNESDFNQLLQSRFGNSEDENDISFLEDVTDTVNSLRENQDSGGYKQKYEVIDFLVARATQNQTQNQNRM